MVHAFEIRCATTQRANPPRVPTPGPPTIPTVQPERVANALAPFRELMTQQRELIAISPMQDGLQEHLHGLYRVVGTANADEVASALEQSMIDLAWYRIRHHECYHDETPTRPCGSWVIVREFGSVPEGL